MQKLPRQCRIFRLNRMCSSDLESENSRFRNPLNESQSEGLGISDWAVAPGDNVNKGDLVGFTGESASGFDHLHFEIRDAPADDKFSGWQRDAIHPLLVLPYSDPTPPTITFDSVDISSPMTPVIEVTVTTPRVDVNRVELRLYDFGAQLLEQPGNTPDARGYNVHPSWFDLTEWNRQYTHKDSSGVPWERLRRGRDQPVSLLSRPWRVLQRQRALGSAASR